LCFRALIESANLLCFFLGVFGAHRFYVGKVGTGILQLITIGGLGLWTLFDFILIIVGAFTDSDGNKITEWTLLEWHEGAICRDHWTSRIYIAILQ